MLFAMTILVEGYPGTNIKVDLGRLLLRMPFINLIFPRKQNKQKVAHTFLLNIFFKLRFYSQMVLFICLPLREGLI